MSTTRFIYNDGGRSNYFTAKKVGDCATRATAIASQKDYKEVYNLYKKIGGKTPRDGVSKTAIRKVMEQLGAKWVPCMAIGSGCKTHLRAEELPKGRIVCSCSGHLVAVIDGVINDT